MRLLAARIALFVIAVFHSNCELFQFKATLVYKNTWTPKSSINALTQMSCTALCTKSTMSCSAVYFNQATGVCELGSKVSLVEAPSDPGDGSVVSVNVNPAVSWHLIVAGYDGSLISSTELFNWQTGQICSFDPLPIANAGLAGALFNGTPVACGGNSGSGLMTTCYVYKNKSWTRISDQIMTNKYQALVAVPRQGLFAFGGQGNSLTTAQKLTSLSGTWTTGPPMYLNQADYGMCVVQLSDIVTVFLGGFIDNYRIVTYDWFTKAYTVNPTKLSGKRAFGQCGLTRTPDGTLVVAAIGGAYTESKGMEIWNPTDGSVQTIFKEIPPEYGQSRGVIIGPVLSVNNNTNLILHGGRVDSPLKGIWRFKSSSQSWTQVANIIRPRSEHTVIPAPGLECP